MSLKHKTVYSFAFNNQFSGVFREYRLDVVESVFIDGKSTYVLKQFPLRYIENCPGNDYFFVSLHIKKDVLGSDEEKDKMFCFSWVKDCPPPYFSYSIVHNGLPTASVELD